MTNSFVKALIALFFLLLGETGFSQHAVMDEFMDLRFGMFIHYGPVTLRGTEISWSRGHEVPVAEYDSLYKEFSPVLFNADTWVKAAKDAGMKYLTITAKHHDGFCLWPTEASPYNISHAPFKRDIVGELAQACRRQGITFCVYFTVLDWHDPHYMKGDIAAFKATMKAELKEIITRYHPFMLWFDGNWESQWTAADGKEMYRYLKGLDHNIVINNRLGKGSPTLNDSTSSGDFLTPEQKIGQLNMTDPWESCITICNQWAWKPNDSMKSLKQCIQTLVKTAGGNGNLLFNVGPMMDGRMEARQVRRLKEMGDWLHKYGESIYGTKGGPYPPGEAFAATRKGNKIYLHILEKKAEFLTLPVLPGVHIKKASFMHGDAVAFTEDGTTGYRFVLPDTLPDTNCSVIVLELDKNAEGIPVIQL